MKHFATVAILLSALAALMSPCQGFCVPSAGWYTMSLVERMGFDETEIVALAYVSATHPAHPYKYPYTADLTLECVYKDTHPSEPLPLDLKGVAGFGGTWDCAETRVQAGQQYIIFLRRTEHSVEVAEVNRQSGAEQAIPSRLAKVHAKYPECIWLSGS